MKRVENIIEYTISTNKTLYEAIFLAIFLSFGVNIISNSFFVLDSDKGRILFIFGVIIIGISCFYLIKINLEKRKFDISFSGFLINDHKKDKILNIEYYDLPTELNNYLKPALSEDNTLKKEWTTGKSKKGIYLDVRNLILEDLLEYLILEKLSITLTDFFNARVTNPKKLKFYNSKEIPKVLLNNRFLNLFSKSPAQRDAFKKEKIEDKVIFFYSPEGIYNKFELVLPKNCKISKFKNKGITIESDIIRLSIKVQIDKYTSLLPQDFLKIYLGLKEGIYSRYDPIKIRFSLKAILKIKSLFMKDGWNYYIWLDKFIREIKKDFSSSYFFDSINWRNIRTSQYLNNLKKKK